MSTPACQPEPTPSYLLGPLLKSVSRSFYLTLRALPAEVRQPIGLAYLLARTADTIADTNALPVERRGETLTNFETAIREPGGPWTDPEDWIQTDAPEAEKALLTHTAAGLALLRRQAPEDTADIRAVLQTIISGQLLDLKRFATSTAEAPAALSRAADLEDYTWRVAGCVGEFWTRICQRHLWAHAPIDPLYLRINGIRFGQGLQLVNILRDLPRDLQQGRCYLPEDELAGAGLKPADLLGEQAEEALRPIYDAWLEKAMDHLAAGWNYTLALPPSSIRVRLACSWPLLIGARTLGRLREEPVLRPRHPVKISRKELKRLMFQSVILYPWQSKWARMFAVQARLSS